MYLFAIFKKIEWQLHVSARIKPSSVCTRLCTKISNHVCNAVQILYAPHYYASPSVDAKLIQVGYISASMLNKIFVFV